MIVHFVMGLQPLIYVTVMSDTTRDQLLMNIQMRNCWVVIYQLDEQEPLPPTR